MSLIRMLGQALALWSRRGADEAAAALAYFMPFALTPLVILSITIVSLLSGSERIITMLTRWGNNIDPSLTALLYSSVRNFDGVAAHYYFPTTALIFLSVMIYFAFNTLITGLQRLWSVEFSGWRSYGSRFIRITIFIIVLQVYLVTMILVEDTFSWLTSFGSWPVWSFLNYVLNFFLTILLLTITYGLLAFRSPSFKGRFWGALVAGILLFFSRELVAIHFATAPVQTLFGAAGLLITLLVWVYVVAGVILYGAAFAKVYDDSKH